MSTKEVNQANESTIHDRITAELDKLGLKQYVCIALVDDKETEMTGMGKPTWHYQALVEGAKRIVQTINADAGRLMKENKASLEEVRDLKKDIIKSAMGLIVFIEAELNMSTQHSDVAH